METVGTGSVLHVMQPSRLFTDVVHCYRLDVES